MITQTQKHRKRKIWLSAFSGPQIHLYLLQIYIYVRRPSELAKKGGVSWGCIMNTERNVSIST